MSRDFRFVFALLTACIGLPLVGCGGGADRSADRPPVSIDELEAAHEGHSHADNYVDAIAELEEMRGVIAKAFADGDLDAAHDPLHEVGHVLDELVSLAKKDGVSEEGISAIESAVNTLMDNFGAVDEKFHGEEGKDYSEVKDAIDAAMEQLKAYLPKTE